MSHSKEHLKPKFLEQFEKNGGLAAMTCGMVGICPATYYSWLDKDSEFKDACEFILDKTTDKIKKTMYNSAIEDKHYPSMKYIIETRCFRQRENEIAQKLKLESIDSLPEDVDLQIAILERALNEARTRKANENPV